MKDFNGTGEIGMKDDPEHNAILKTLFSVFLLLVWSALFGSLTVLIQLLLNLPPMAYQFIPLGIFCSLYVLYVMRAFRERSVNYTFLVMPVVPFALVHGIAYTEFIQQAAPVSFRCFVVAIIGLMTASVALFARLIPDRQLKHEQPPK